MKEKENIREKIWPFRARVAIICVPFLLIGQLLIINMIEYRLNWPDKGSDNVLLIGVFLISILPIILLLIDTIVERGGSFEIKGMKFDFSVVERTGDRGLILDVNIGEKGVAINESNVVMILEALRKATGDDVVVIDLEDGMAWWETRLFVLMAGAERLKKPSRVVFVAAQEKKIRSFIGWAYSKDLFEYLLKYNTQYARTYSAAQATVLQWLLAEPSDGLNSNATALYWPQQFKWLENTMTTKSGNIAFDYKNMVPNEMFAEQLIARDLGERIESLQTPADLSISVDRLNRIFGSFLFRKSIEQNGEVEDQLDAFFESSEPYIAVTKNGTFISLISKMSVFNNILKQLTAKNSLTK